MELRGHFCATSNKKGQIVLPLLRRGANSPHNVPGNNNVNVGALGMGCGHLSNAPRLNS